MLDQILIINSPENSTKNGSEPDPSTATPPLDPGTSNNGTGGWLGLDSTQILVIFLIIVAAVLVIFLLIYYYVIKGMRQRNVNKLVQKSASGSIGEEKARNIFANPERHLAVDQSTRINPDSPASVSSLEQQQITPPVTTEKEVLPPQTQPDQSISHPSDGQQPTPIISNQRSSQSLVTQTSKQRMVQTTKVAPTQAIKSDKKDDSRKSNSLGRKQRGRVNQTNNTETNDQLGVFAALAGVRNTLKGTD